MWRIGGKVYVSQTCVLYWRLQSHINFPHSEKDQKEVLGLCQGIQNGTRLSTKRARLTPSAESSLPSGSRKSRSPLVQAAAATRTRTRACARPSTTPSPGTCRTTRLIAPSNGGQAN